MKENMYPERFDYLRDSAIHELNIACGFCSDDDELDVGVFCHSTHSCGAFCSRVGGHEGQHYCEKCKENF